MIDLNKIPEFFGQIASQVSQIGVGNFLGHVVTYNQQNPTILVGVLVAALALAILYSIYRSCKKVEPTSEAFNNSTKIQLLLEYVEENARSTRDQLLLIQARLIATNKDPLKSDARLEEEIKFSEERLKNIRTVMRNEGLISIVVEKLDSNKIR